MLENDMYIAGIGPAVLKLLSLEVISENHQRGITLVQEFSKIFGNMRPQMTKNDITYDKSQFPIIKN